MLLSAHACLNIKSWPLPDSCVVCPGCHTPRFSHAHPRPHLSSSPPPSWYTSPRTAQPAKPWNAGKVWEQRSGRTQWWLTKSQGHFGFASSTIAFSSGQTLPQSLKAQKWKLPLGSSCPLSWKTAQRWRALSI